MLARVLLVGMTTLSAYATAHGAESNQSIAVTPRDLRAGPVRMKLADGQLRYVMVGDKEIVRRIYFGVRDDQWRTPMPQFSEYRVEDLGDHFIVHLAARCRRDAVDYQWTATISGSPEGRIEFEAGGKPLVDFKSNRIGLCVLFGVQSLMSQQFQVTHTSGASGGGEFPRLVSPDLVARQFTRLAYQTPQNIRFSCEVNGAVFDMEDQRNWGDTSFKAYATLPYAYKLVRQGQELRHKVTIKVQPPAIVAPTRDLPRAIIRIGGIVPASRVPRLVLREDWKGAKNFSQINMDRAKFRDRAELTWAYTPREHQPDLDTMMENLAGIMDQALTARSFAPAATLRVGPIHFNHESWKDGPQLDATPQAAAWLAGYLQYLSAGGVQEADVGLAAGPADLVVREAQPYAGQPVREVISDLHAPAAAFAIDSDRGLVLFVCNQAGHPTNVTIAGLGNARLAQAVPVTPEAAAQQRTIPIAAGELTLELMPYQVLRVMLP